MLCHVQSECMLKISDSTVNRVAYPYIMLQTSIKTKAIYITTQNIALASKCILAVMIYIKYTSIDSN